MLYEYTKLLISLQEVKLTETISIIVSLITLCALYLLVRKYFISNANKGYLKRVVMPSFLIALLFFAFSVVSGYLINLVSISLCAGEYCWISRLFDGLYIVGAILASLVVFIIMLFIFSLKKVDLLKVPPSQNLSKAEKSFVWFGVSILTLYFLFYLPVIFYHSQINFIAADIKELVAGQEKVKLESEIIEYAKKHAEANKFLCLIELNNNLHLSQAYTILEDKLYEGTPIPDRLIGTVEENKIFMKEDFRRSGDCYNNLGENMYEKYKIIQ